MPAVATPNDADLVSRYQSLICALAYNATGSLSRSEDLAQEVFLIAWKELRQLREPAKLRPWLCGIARRLTAKTLHRETREPACTAEELTDEHHTPSPDPAGETISREEETILWRTLEQIPETYREPLILFYREGRSIQNVADALELTEDATKQRLSRGRKMLQDRVAAFVEGALRQSTPGRAFTLAVIAALPLVAASTTTATAAGLGSAAVKTSALASGAGAMALTSVLLGPIVGCLGAWFGIRAGLDSAESDQERTMIRRYAGRMAALVFVFIVAVLFATPFTRHISPDHPILAIGIGVSLPIVYGIALAAMIFSFRRTHRRIRAEQASHRSPEATAHRAAMWGTVEYRSPWTLLGLPLFHLRIGRLYGEKLRPAIGWIAIGDCAIGILVAVGACSIGGISIGGASVGLVAIGGVSVGVLSLAGIAFGLYGAIGGLAVGYLSFGGWACAWHAAQGGMAAAHDFALGDVAHARHANDPAARQAISALPFSQLTSFLVRHPLLFSLSWTPLLLNIWQALRARRSLKANPS